MATTNEHHTFDLDMALFEIDQAKNLITAVQWWLDGLMESQSKSEIETTVLLEGKIYDSILCAVQSNLTNLQKNANAASNQKCAIRKQEMVQE